MTEKGVKRQRGLLSDALEFGGFKFCAASKQIGKVLCFWMCIALCLFEARS